MKIPSYQIRVSVDNVYLQSGEVGFLLQKDPFPGGHRYKLRISDIETKKYFSSMPIGKYKNPNEKICADVTFVVTNLIEWMATYQEDFDETEFLLNTIEILIIESNEVYLEGICSEIIKTSHT
jgi:hypothetical protein